MPLPRARRHAGFTLLEILVTLTLLAVGLLALASTSTAIARLNGAGEWRARAAALMDARLERLRAGPCAPAAGVDRDRAITARWSTVVAGGVQRLEEDVTLPDPARPAHGELVWSASPC